LLRRSKHGPLKVNDNIGTAAGRRAREIRRSAAMAATVPDEIKLIIDVARAMRMRLLFCRGGVGESARLVPPAR
jgi:hypothetical protein